MLQEAFDFRDESEALFAIMKDLPDAAFAVPTQFKGWTLTDVLQHLHVWNVAAYESYADEVKFDAFFKGGHRGGLKRQPAAVRARLVGQPLRSGAVDGLA